MHPFDGIGEVGEQRKVAGGDAVMEEAGRLSEPCSLRRATPGLHLRQPREELAVSTPSRKLGTRPRRGWPAPVRTGAERGVPGGDQGEAGRGRRPGRRGTGRRRRRAGRDRGDEGRVGAGAERGGFLLLLVGSRLAVEVG